MHIPTDQFERVPIYMLSPTPSPPNEKSNAELFNWPKPDPSENTASESENEGESKSLPPKINFPRNRMSRIVRMLTLHHESHLVSETNSKFHSGPLVKVCRDCKILVRHLIDMGHTNFGGTASIEQVKWTPYSDAYYLAHFCVELWYIRYAIEVFILALFVITF